MKRLSVFPKFLLSCQPSYFYLSLKLYIGEEFKLSNREFVSESRNTVRIRFGFRNQSFLNSTERETVSEITIKICYQSVEEINFAIKERSRVHDSNVFFDDLIQGITHECI